MSSKFVDCMTRNVDLNLYHIPRRCALNFEIKSEDLLCVVSRPIVVGLFYKAV